MKLEQFNELFSCLYSPSREQTTEIAKVNARWQILRTLDSLGYCEFDFAGRMVYMCKPSLVLLPGFGLPKVALVGARSPLLMQKLKQAVEKRRDTAILKYIHHSGVNAVMPAALHIEADDIETIRGISRDVRIGCETSWPAAWRLADFSSSLDSVRESLNFESRVAPNWKRRVFSKRRLVFSEFESDKPRFLAEYKDPVRQQLHHWLWLDGLAAPVGRDWGRYIFLAEEGLHTLLYDEKHQRLTVPVTVPLPCVLARAVALCTGTAPLFAKTCSKRIGAVPPQHPVQVYSGVTYAIAELVASKLCQTLIYTHLEVNKRGILYA